MAAVVSVSAFTGCIPNNFTREEERTFLKEAEKAAEAYLGTAYSGAAIRGIRAETTVDENGYELTDFASGQFVWQKQEYDFVVNAETGVVYTSVRLEEIKEQLKEDLMRELGIAQQEMAVVSCNIHYLKPCRESRMYAETGLRDFDNVFPEGETADELIQKILGDTDEYSFSMGIQYKGEAIPQEIMEEDPPFPTLSYVEIYHVAEEHGLNEGEYDFLILPSLSEEILWRSYSADNAGYTRNEVMERDGFLVVYNAYEKKREKDSVTVEVIDVEDIIFAITEDYISLDCSKENFIMYLSSTDKETAERYRYAFDRLNSSEKPQAGTWYPYEDRYVYAGGRFTEVPHEFNSRHRKTNIIYTRQGADMIQ